MNALCERACFRGEASRDRTRPITEEAIFDAQEQLILARETHLDQLADKLDEDRVRRVIEPLPRGDDEVSSRCRTWSTGATSSTCATWA